MNPVWNKIARKIQRLAGHKPSLPPSPFSEDVRDEFKGIFANLTLQCLLDNFQFQTVLDIGSGAGKHAALFEKYGRQVTALDFGVSIYYRQKNDKRNTVIGNYLEIEFEEKFDCIWASHVLEHQPNVNLFLRKIHRDLKEEGILAITVPPLKHEIVGGHLSLWNAGMLLYHLVFAGFDCKDARIKSYGYNVSVIVKKRNISLPTLDYDNGDIDRLAAFLPDGLGEGFNGDIPSLNWPFDQRS